MTHPATEYLTLLADPAPEWWAEVEGQAQAVTFHRTPAESAGRACWRITLHGEAQAVEGLRNWLLRRCQAQGLHMFMV